MALSIKGLVPHTFTSAKERDDFAKTVILNPETGLADDSVDLAKLAACIGATIAGIGQLNEFAARAIINGSIKAREVAAIADSAAKVEIVPNRNAKGFSVYAGPAGQRRHLVWVGSGTVQRIFELHDQLESIKANGLQIDGKPYIYFSARDSYVIQRGKQKGEMSKPVPAMVLTVKPGSFNVTVVAKGAEADEFAKKHGLTQYNNPSDDAEDESSES